MGYKVIADRHQMEREIEFMEGYRMMRTVGADWLSSVFMAVVWVLRGDKISVDKSSKRCYNTYIATRSTLWQIISQCSNKRQ